MKYKTELVEDLTVSNITEKIDMKISEMEKSGYQLVTLSFWESDKAVLVFKKGLKNSLH